MPTPFLSSEEFDERAHQLYNEGLYDEALDVLREGLSLYPNSVELHIGVGYARLAREEFAWARRSFEEALILEPEHEDALAGLGETLLWLGQRDAALKSFRKILDLGYSDDVDLMLQCGRALFRGGIVDAARDFFDTAVQQTPDNAEAVACIGYVQHRLGEDEQAITTLRRSLQLDPDYAEARIYLANALYDRGDFEAALYHLDRTGPEDHWDDLGIWRLLELKKGLARVKEDDLELKPWEQRLADLEGEPSDIDEMLAEIEARAAEAADAEVRGQLELFGQLLTELVDQEGDEPGAGGLHRIERDGREFRGSWDEIVQSMRAASAFADRTVGEFMLHESRRGYAMSGVEIPVDDAERFLRASADAGLLRIVR